jgi:hypothetical protein
VRWAKTGAIHERILDAAIEAITDATIERIDRLID